MWDDLLLPANVVAQLDGLRASVLEAAHLPLQSPPRHTLLWGEPGTGKTTVLRAFAKSIDGSGIRVEHASSSDFKDGRIVEVGNTVREIFDRIRQAAPVVLLLDLEQGPYSDDCLFPSLESLVGGHDLTYYDTVLIDSALKEMDRTCFDRKAPVWMIGEIFSPDRLDSRMRRRFSLEIELPLPDESGRRGILKREITSRAPALDMDISGLGFDLDEACSAVAARTEGESGRGLVYVVQKAFESSAQRTARDDSTQRTLAREDLLAAAEPRR